MVSRGSKIIVSRFPEKRRRCISTTSTSAAQPVSQMASSVIVSHLPEIREALRMPPLAPEANPCRSVVQAAVRSSTEKRNGCMCSTIVGRFPLKCRVGALRTLNSVEQPVLKMGIDWATASLSDMRAALKLPPLASEAKLSCSVGGSPKRHLSLIHI